MRRKSANRMPPAIGVTDPTTTSWHQRLEPLRQLDEEARPSRPLGHKNYEEEKEAANDMQAEEKRTFASPLSRPTGRRTSCGKMKPKLEVSLSASSLIKCRRSVLNLVILSLFIIHNQIDSSKAQQANRLQHQQQQQASHWQAANATARSVSSLINQVAAAKAAAANRSEQMQATSSHKLSSSSSRHQAIESPPRSQQATNEGPDFESGSPPPGDTLEAAAAATGSGGAQNSEVSSESQPPGDNFEVPSGAGSPSDSDESGQPATAGEDETEADAEEQPAGGDEASSPPAPIDRREDNFEETQGGGGASVGSYEGIQLRPARQSSSGSQDGVDPNQGGPLTTLRTMSQPDTMTTSRGQPEGRLGQAGGSAGSTRPLSPPVTSSPPMLTSAGSFDVTLGSDRMLIKPADDYETRLLLSSSPSPLPSRQQQQRNRHPISMTTTSQMPPEMTQAQQPTTTTTTTRAPRPQLNSNFHELATESVVHHHHELPVDNRAPPPPTSAGGFHERRLDLVGSSSNNEQTSTGSSSASQPRVGANSQQQQQSQHFIGDTQPQQELSIASICYTPLSLLMVILATILITLIVCLSVYYLFKYLKRHQFDLVANSKHFDHKHLSSSSNGYSMPGAAAGLGAAATTQPAASQLSLGNSQNYLLPSGSSWDFHHQIGGAGACPAHLFQPDERCNKCVASMSGRGAGGGCGGPLAGGGQQAGRTILATNVSSYAFRNPYFTDEPHRLADSGIISPDPRAPTQASPSDRLREAAMAARTRDSPVLGSDSPPPAAGGGLLRAASSNLEQMHFIESHIADLHNRQVTSSVKELSSLGADTTQQVVDLTSEEQQARVRAHSKEGDLVAIDLTGHDIIGLGFDVCGNQRDGIFIRSVSSHGPARESGCIQAGDRIKCININFEDVTIQDACDILNAAAPYKMRLLIEKKIATIGDLNRMQQSNHNRPSLQPVQRPMMALLQPGGGGGGGLPHHGLFEDTHQRGPLEATRAYFRRLVGRLATGRQHQQELGSNSGNIWRAQQRPASLMRRQVEDEPQRTHNHQRMMMMATATNPLLMMNQCKQALPGEDGVDGSLYKLAPIGSLAGARDPTERGQAPTTAHLLAGPAASDGRVEISERDISRESSCLTGGEQEHLSDKENDLTPRIKPATARQEQAQDQQNKQPPQRHRRGESCHINGAFTSDELEGNSRHHDERATTTTTSKGKYLSRDDESDMEDAVAGVGLHDKDNKDDNDEEEDEQHPDHHQQQQEDAERLYDYERQSKLMASGETFNSKSRLTM